MLFCIDQKVQKNYPHSFTIYSAQFSPGRGKITRRKAVLVGSIPANFHKQKRAKRQTLELLKGARTLTKTLLKRDQLELLKDSFSYKFFAARNSVGFVLTFLCYKILGGNFKF